MTLVSLLVALVVGRMAQYTSDQVMVQRLQTTRSLPDTRRAFVVNAAGDALWMIGLSFVGLALFAYFQRTPLPPEYRDRQAVAVFHVAGVSGRRRRPGDRGDHGGVDVEHRLRDQLLQLGGGGRSLQPAVARRRASAPARSPPTTSGASCGRRASLTVLFGALGTTLACNVSRLGSLLEINNQGSSTRSPVRCSASTCWRCSAAGAQRGRARGRGARRGRSATTWPITAASASCGHRRSAWRRRWSSAGVLAAAVAGAADGARRAR